MPTPPRWQSFPALESPFLFHAFSNRTKNLSREENDRVCMENLHQTAPPFSAFVTGEQPHGNGVAIVDDSSQEKIPSVDALVTNKKGIMLAVRVADCGALYFFDPLHRAIGLAHSGRKGTELNIVGATIEKMKNCFGSDPNTMIVQLSPCIRPPHYEVDFAATIARQAKEKGVVSFFDCGLCTASDLERYYSYRAEKGKTGRMWAVAMLL